MRIAVEQRGDKWLAQVVHVGELLHWIKQTEIQIQMHTWARKNCADYYVDGWQFFFYNQQDLTLFLLRWDGTN